MNFMSRLLGGFVVLIALVLVVACCFRDKLIQLYVPTDQFGNRLSLFEIHLKGQLLSRETQLFKERFSAKDKIVAALIARKLTLREAAAQYRSLYEDSQSWNNPFRPQPDYNNGIAWCREVIVCTMTRLRPNQTPYQCELLQQRLEGELAEQLSNDGTVVLPD